MPIRLAGEQRGMTGLSAGSFLRPGTGKREAKSGAASRVGCGPQAAAVGLDDRPADREPHARALSLGAEERVKDLVRLLRRNAHSCIRDRNQQLTTSGHQGSDCKLALALCVLHRLDTVEHEIHENLLQLHSVSHDPRQVLRQFSKNRNGMSGCFAAQQDNHLLDDLAHIHQIGLRRALLKQLSKPADDIAARVTAMTIRAADSRASPISGCFARQPPQASSGIGRRGRNRLVDLMRQ